MTCRESKRFPNPTFTYFRIFTVRNQLSFSTKIPIYFTKCMLNAQKSGSICGTDQKRQTLYFVSAPLLSYNLCFYSLFGNKTKNFLSTAFFISAVFAIIDTFVFSGNYGSINPTLLFMEPQNFFPGLKSTVLNLFLFVLL